jgi:hypothetical protein
MLNGAAPTNYGVVDNGGQRHGDDRGYLGVDVCKQLLHELHEDPGSAITIQEDNQSCIALSKIWT